MINENWVIGCVKTKADKPMAAAKLYKSDLFKKSFKYAQKTCDRTYILSAQYGLVEVDKIISPYDLTMRDLSKQERLQWSVEVLEKSKIVGDGGR